MANYSKHYTLGTTGQLESQREDTVSDMFIFILQNVHMVMLEGL